MIISAAATTVIYFTAADAAASLVFSAAIARTVFGFVLWLLLFSSKLSRQSFVPRKVFMLSLTDNSGWTEWVNVKSDLNSKSIREQADPYFVSFEFFDFKVCQEPTNLHGQANINGCRLLGFGERLP